MIVIKIMISILIIIGLLILHFQLKINADIEERERLKDKEYKQEKNDHKKRMYDILMETICMFVLNDLNAKSINVLIEPEITFDMFKIYYNELKDGGDTIDGPQTYYVTHAGKKYKYIIKTTEGIIKKIVLSENNITY